MKKVEAAPPVGSGLQITWPPEIGGMRLASFSALADFGWTPADFGRGGGLMVEAEKVVASGGHAVLATYRCRACEQAVLLVCTLGARHSTAHFSTFETAPDGKWQAAGTPPFVITAMRAATTCKLWAADFGRDPICGCTRRNAKAG